MARHIYVHIPFCARKCDYCDFYSVPSGQVEDYEEKFFGALYREIELTPIVQDVNSDTIDTVYIGGGTPSLPQSSYIARLLELLKNKFDLNAECEITIECNPASVNISKFDEYKKAGVNRISLGIQSLHDDTLRTLGRLHDSKRALEAICEAKSAGFNNISVDLMLGIPGQKLEEVIEDASRILSLGINHISMYSLIIEEETRFYERYSKTIEELVSPDLEREMYHTLRAYLSDNGLEPYEISNCGKPSIHNMSYWKGMEYYAFGPGASGYLNSKRFTHTRDVKSYIKYLESSEVDINSLICVDEVLSEEAKMREYAMLMFRTSTGIDINEFNNRYHNDINLYFNSELERLERQGFIVFDDGFWRLTHKGLDFANLVFEEFI